MDGPMLDQFVDGPLREVEGDNYGLYIDTECYPTIGIGSLLKEPVYGRQNYEIFLEMDYVEPNGTVLSLEEKQKDIKRIRDFETQCRAGKFNPNSRGGGWWTKNEFKGRRMIYAHGHKMAFDEFCFSKVPALHKKFAQMGVRFCDLPISHQVVLLDIAFQAGAGFVGWGQAQPLIENIKNKNCEGAAKNFSTWNLCTKYANRCKTRLAMFRQPCAGGATK